MRRLPFAVCLVLAAATAAAALALADQGSGAGLRVLSTAGDFELTDSREGTPIFSATGIGPGDSASGTVELGATGSVAADLVLSREDLLDSPGLGGGELSRALALRVTDVTTGAELVYSGALATMPALPLGRFEPGSSRTYEFVATLPAGGPASDQDDVQGAAMSVAYVWTASEAAEPPPQPSGDPRSPSEQPLALAPAPTGAQLAVTRIWRRPQRGLVLARAVCDRPCAIAVRGELWAWGRAGERSASIQLAGAGRVAAGPQRLVVRIPPSLRAWLHANPRGVWARAALVFVARAAGERAVVRRAPWLRHPRWTAPHAATR